MQPLVFINLCVMLEAYFLLTLYSQNQENLFISLPNKIVSGYKKKK